MPSKLVLGENHRRVVSVLLRGLEQMADSVADWLDKKPGILHRLEDDLLPQRRVHLRKQLDQLRAEIRRLNDEIDIQPAVESPRRSIRALLSATAIEIEERKSRRLESYGPLTDAAKNKLDAEFGRLIALLEEMAETVE